MYNSKGTRGGKHAKFGVRKLMEQVMRIAAEFITCDPHVTLYGLAFSLKLGQCYDYIFAPSELHYAAPTTWSVYHGHTV
jgi:hypothetical protein